MEVQNFIDGASVDAQSGSRSDLVDPTTGEVFAQAPVSQAADIDAAYAAAERAFEVWGNTTPAERQMALLKIARLRMTNARDSAVDGAGYLALGYEIGLD